MYSLQSVDVMSCAKIMGAIYGCLALILAPPFLLYVGFTGVLTGQGSGSGFAILFLGIIAPVFYGVAGFIIGALTGWVYNFAARQIGGLRLELRPISATSSPRLGPI
jgi:hypothetical protein